MCTNYMIRTPGGCGQIVSLIWR